MQPCLQMKYLPIQCHDCCIILKEWIQRANYTSHVNKTLSLTGQRKSIVTLFQKWHGLAKFIDPFRYSIDGIYHARKYGSYNGVESFASTFKKIGNGIDDKSTGFFKEVKTVVDANHNHVPNSFRRMSDEG